MDGCSARIQRCNSRDDKPIPWPCGHASSQQLYGHECPCTFQSSQCGTLVTLRIETDPARRKDVLCCREGRKVTFNVPNTRSTYGGTYKDMTLDTADKSTMVCGLGPLGKRDRRGPIHRPIPLPYSAKNNRGTQPGASYKQGRYHNPLMRDH